jgi:hypothetical protein
LKIQNEHAGITDVLVGCRRLQIANVVLVDIIGSAVDIETELVLAGHNIALKSYIAGAIIHVQGSASADTTAIIHWVTRADEVAITDIIVGDQNIG